MLINILNNLGKYTEIQNLSVTQFQRMQKTRCRNAQKNASVNEPSPGYVVDEGEDDGAR